MSFLSGGYRQIIEPAFPRTRSKFNTDEASLGEIRKPTLHGSYFDLIEGSEMRVRGPAVALDRAKSSNLSEEELCRRRERLTIADRSRKNTVVGGSLLFHVVGGFWGYRTGVDALRRLW